MRRFSVANCTTVGKTLGKKSNARKSGESAKRRKKKSFNNPRRSSLKSLFTVAGEHRGIPRAPVLSSFGKPLRYYYYNCFILFFIFLLASGAVARTGRRRHHPGSDATSFADQRLFLYRAPGVHYSSSNNPVAPGSDNAPRSESAQLSPVRCL